MNIVKYLNEVEQAAGFAKKIGRSAIQVSHWKTGFRPIPLELCAKIERATGGQVMRWDLRPEDWWRIWPELIGRSDAPAIPEAAHE